MIAALPRLKPVALLQRLYEMFGDRVPVAGASDDHDASEGGALRRLRVALSVAPAEASQRLVLASVSRQLELKVFEAELCGVALRSLNMPASRCAVPRRGS